MKLLILIFFLPSLLLPSDFSKISSVNFDLVGVVASGNKIAAYGTNGSVYYTYDDAQSWDLIKPFETGNIVNFFIEDDRLIAFLQTGEVSQSFDNGQNWNITNPIDDSVHFVVKGNNDYYIRAKKSIVKLSQSLTLSDSYPLPFVGTIMPYGYLSKNRREMSFIDNRLFVINSSSDGFIFFDKDLIKIDSVDLKISLLKKECYITNLINDSKELIFQGYLDSTYLFKMSADFTSIKVLLNNSDIEYNKKLFEKSSPYVFYYYPYNNKLYTFNNTLKIVNNNYFSPFYNIFELYSKDSANYKGVIDATVVLSQDDIKPFDIVDFVVENDRITGVSTNNFIVTKKINSETTNRVSNLVGSGKSSNLFQINTSDFLLLTPNNIYSSSDTTKTFKKVIGDSAVFKSYLKLDHRFNYYDNDEGKLLYFASSVKRIDSSFVYISDDYGVSFTEKLLKNLSFNNLANKYRIMKIGRNFVIAEYQNGPIIYNYYDENFNFLSSKVESNYRYSNLLGDNLKEFTFIGSNFDLKDYNQYLKSTIDGGENWTDIRTFSFNNDTIWYNDSTQYFTTISNHLRYYKGVESKGKNHVLLATYNPADSIFKIEAMDLQTNEFSLVYQNKQSTYLNTLVELIDGDYFICKGDSLFTTTNLLDYKSWKGQKLPNNGTMLGRIMKSGDYLITYYYDDIHPYDIYRLKWNELTTTGIIENDIEIPPYFYNSSPYPQPTNSLVTTKVYLDKAFTISKSSLKIFDVNGTQVEKGDNVEISGTNWPTTLTWDSSSQPPGVYFIVVDYGESSRAIKVMKE